MNNIEGFVLNGGASSRMGEPKGSLRIGELSFAERAANALIPICDRVCAVGGEFRVDGIETLPDVPWNGRNERASIFGLRSALLHCSTKYAAVLACDMPFVTAEVLERITADIGILETGHADVILPLDKNGWLQPLCAIYERDRSRVAIDAYLESGALQIRGFVATLRAHVVKAANFEDFENADFLFMNINRPEDLVKASRITDK